MTSYYKDADEIVFLKGEKKAKNGENGTVTFHIKLTQVKQQIIAFGIVWQKAQFLAFDLEKYRKSKVFYMYKNFPSFHVFEYKILQTE